MSASSITDGAPWSSWHESSGMQQPEQQNNLSSDSSFECVMQQNMCKSQSLQLMEQKFQMQQAWIKAQKEAERSLQKF